MNIGTLFTEASNPAKVIGGNGGSALPSLPMHIPDGFLSAPVSLLFWILAIIGVGCALWRVNRELDERQVPLMGVLAAAIFAGQMLNFPVAGGASGHLLGAALATILLGPWASVIVLTCVVSVQALLFQDGGLLALGANIFNMAIVGSVVAYTIYQITQRLAGGKRGGILVGGFVAAWFSIVLASLVCALQLAASGASPANIALPAMGGIHMLIGIGEGLITVGALSFLMAARRDLVEKGASRATLQRGVIVAGLAIALLLAVLSPLASAHPDGLEWVAKGQGFLDKARAPLFSLIPDYVLPGISSKAAATIAAGILGTLLVFGVAWGVARSGRRRVTG